MADSTIDLIRQANPIPGELAPPPMEEVWRRIEAGSVPDLRDHGAPGSSEHGAASARAAARRGLRGRRFTIGGTVTAVMSVLILAIAAGALLLLGGHGHRLLPPSASSGFATRQQVLQTLGVLRSPPNAAARRAIACAKSAPDPRTRTFSACRSSAVPSFFTRPPPAARLNRRANQVAREMDARFGYPRLDASLLRVVPIPQFDASVTIAPATWRPSRSSQRRAEGLLLALNYSRGQSGSGPEPTSLSAVTNQGLWISDAQATPRMTAVRGAELVPDGVAKVELEPIRIVSSPAPVTAGQFGTITSEVRDNVAAFRFPVLTATNPNKPSALYGVTVVARATWFDRSGNVVNDTTTQIYLSITVRGQGPGGRATNP